MSSSAHDDFCCGKRVGVVIIGAKRYIHKVDSAWLSEKEEDAYEANKDGNCGCGHGSVVWVAVVPGERVLSG